ncbi:flavodoxin [candidate division KSB1 bacterium]|nr:flavodoxin [candidate division KSB1 bacterium]
MKKTLIVYASSHGCTESCAYKLAESLPVQPEMINLKQTGKIDLSAFDMVLIGGSIHAGKMQRKVKQFCSKHLSELIQKQIGLFLCCMEQDAEKAQQQFDSAYPAELRQISLANGFFGGEFNFEKMNALQRYIIKKIAKTDKSISRISEKNISEFASIVSKQLKSPGEK